jgi:maltooligosyltrehalose trehalohydrolase
MYGAELTKEGVQYCLWAPGQDAVSVVVQRAAALSEFRTLPMARDKTDHFRVLDPEGGAGDRYQYQVGDMRLPDPASRSQPNGVHGPSLVVDARAYPWSDDEWKRPPFRDLVIYELHVGTFTSEGTFRAAIEKLPHLRSLGITAIELMPIGDFPGRWGWGYDGVQIYAPARVYGSPDDLRALVDAAHRHGIAVILDVVYNHFGPDGNYLGCFSRAYFNAEHHTPWGDGFNFDAAQSEQVRKFFVANPVYWMEQFHIDGFRLDATHAIADKSRPHILAEIAAAIHACGGYVIAEDARNETRLLESPQDGGYGFDGVWADDFHHVLSVGQTGAQEGYYRDFDGTLDELIETLQHGWLYRGRFSAAADRKRGTECRHLPPSKFVHCISNHDQSGNRAFGDRAHQIMRPAAYRTLSMLLCLTPYTPMLFMGQEWAATNPFLYFTDHNAELGAMITLGRRREFSDFAEFTDPATRERIPDPQSEETFLKSKLDWEEVRRGEHAEVLALYRECLHLRQRSAAFRPVSRDTWEVEALPFEVGAIRMRTDDETYLLIFDPKGGHSGDLAGCRIARLEAGWKWEVKLSTEERRFGGGGARLYADGKVHFDHAGAVVLRSVKR